MGIDCKRFVIQPVNGDFICSICEDVFENPVERRSCEHIYCNECIIRWLLYNPICPIDRQRLTQSDLQEVPRVFKSLLGSLQIRCLYAQNGCTQSIQLESLPVHEQECTFGPSPSSSCPNSCGFTGKLDQGAHSCIEVLKKTVQEQSVTIRQQEMQIANMRQLQRRADSRVPLMAILRSPIESRSSGGRTPGADSSDINREGIEKLWRKGVIKSRTIFDAMIAYNLIHFYGRDAFKDGWAFGHAKNLEAVIPHLTPTLTKVLVSNNFSGYFQACLSNILGSSCKIYTIIDGSTNGIQVLRTNYPQILSSNRVIPINTIDASNEASYSMIIDFSKEKVCSGRFDRLVAEGSLIVNPWAPSKLRQRVNSEIRHVLYYSFFGEKKYRYSNHGSTRPLI